MDFALTPEENEWVDKAAHLGPEFAARARHYDEAGAFPEEDFDTLRREGFLALSVPKDCGGLAPSVGYPWRLPYLVVRTLAAASSGTAWCLMIHYHQCGYIARLGTNEQRLRFLGDVARRGVLLGSTGSEVNLTQFTAAPNTKTQLTFAADVTAVKGGLRVNCQKHFCSMAPVAEYLIFWGLAPGTSTSEEGLVIAVVPSKTPGITFEPGGWDEAIGQRCTMTWTTNYKDVFIPWADVLGEPGDFIQKDPYNYELSQAAHLLGTAEGALDFIFKVLKERPYLLKDDTVMYDVGRMESALQGCVGSFFYSNSLWEQGKFGEAEMASLKTLQSIKETALFITTTGFDVIGTRALLRSNPFERAWRDARSASLHTRASQHMRMVVESKLSGEYFPKRKYGPRLTSRKTWKDLGLGPDSASLPAGEQTARI